jgi:hypothetical protein
LNIIVFLELLAGFENLDLKVSLSIKEIKSKDLLRHVKMIELNKLYNNPEAFDSNNNGNWALKWHLSFMCGRTQKPKHVNHTISKRVNVFYKTVIDKV